MSKRIVYYYQTFNGLKDILYKGTPVTHIHLSSVHFGVKNGYKYIQLNDNLPSDPIFYPVWSDIAAAAKLGIKIVLMIGGAGGGYNALFSDFKTYYDFLYLTLTAHPYITGIDLDVEEEVKLSDIQMLMKQIKRDFPHFTISFAPVQSSLESDHPGLGGFSYKELYNSPEGKLIDYFNGQFYSDYSETALSRCIQTGYPASKVVMGMLSEQDFSQITKQLKIIIKEQPELGGVFIWEYFNAPKGWDKTIKAIYIGESTDQLMNLMESIAISPCSIS